MLEPKRGNNPVVKNVNIIIAIRIIFGILSTIPSIILIIVFISKAKARTFSNIVAIQLMVSVFFFSISFFIPPQDPANFSLGLCKFQTFLNNAFDISSLGLSTSLTLLNYAVLCISEIVKLKKVQFQISIFIICWFIPGMFIGLSLVYGDIKPNETKMCVFHEDFFSYVEIAYNCLIILTHIVFSVLLFFKIKELFRKTNMMKNVSKFYFRLIIYIAFQFTVYIPYIVDILIEDNYENKVDSYFIWFLIRDGTDSIKGFCFSVVFGYNAENISLVREIFCCQSPAVSEVTIEEMTETVALTYDEISILNNTGTL